MASSADMVSFENTYGSLAASVGQQLGVSPGIILAQWAYESDSGTSRQATQLGNLAGIGGTTPRAYASPSAFAADFVSVIQRNYPGAVGSGTDAGAYVNALAAPAQGGTNPAGLTYYGIAPGDYLAGITARAGQLSAVAGNSGGGGFIPAPGFADNPIVYDPGTGQVSPNLGASGGSISQPSNLAGTGMAWLQGIGINIGTVAFGLVIAVVAVASGMFGGGAQRIVVNTAKGAVS